MKNLINKGLDKIENAINDIAAISSDAIENCINAANKLYADYVKSAYKAVKNFYKENKGIINAVLFWIVVIISVELLVPYIIAINPIAAMIVMIGYIVFNFTISMHIGSLFIDKCFKSLAIKAVRENNYSIINNK